MVEIQPTRTGRCSRTVPAGKDSVNLKPAVGRSAQGARLHRRDSSRAPSSTRRASRRPTGRPPTRSSASTARAAAGSTCTTSRRASPPSTGWIPPFAAQRLVVGDALHSLGTLGERMLRLDANGFLGIEVGPSNGRAWSEGHPLSVTSNQLIAGLVRKLGGFTFQELNLTLEDIKAMSQGGADLSYDFVTRPAYHHALVTGDAEFLRLMLGAAEDLPDRSGRPHPRAPEPRRAHPRARALLDAAQGRHVHLPRQEAEGQRAARASSAPRCTARSSAPPRPTTSRPPTASSCTTATVIAAALGIRDV